METFMIVLRVVMIIETVFNLTVGIMSLLAKRKLAKSQ